MDQPAQAKQGKETSIATPHELLQPLSSTSLTGSAAGVAESPSRAAEEIRRALDTEKQAASSAITVVADSHARFAEELHNYLREYIRNADQKATFFFAGATALLAFLHSQKGTSRWLKDVQTWTVVQYPGAGVCFR